MSAPKPDIADQKIVAWEEDLGSMRVAAVAARDARGKDFHTSLRHRTVMSEAAVDEQDWRPLEAFPPLTPLEIVGDAPAFQVTARDGARSWTYHRPDTSEDLWFGGSTSMSAARMYGNTLDGVLATSLDLDPATIVPLWRAIPRPETRDGDANLRAAVRKLLSAAARADSEPHRRITAWIVDPAMIAGLRAALEASERRS